MRFFQLIERNDLLDVEFAKVAQAGRFFSFRLGFGTCAIKLGSSDSSSSMPVTRLYDKWDPDMFAEPRQLHFTVTAQTGFDGDCIGNGSVWEKVEARNLSPDTILTLRQVSGQGAGQTISVSTYKGWKGTVMAKKFGGLKVLACQ